MIYVYECDTMGCEDRQRHFCGYSYQCPFCGMGSMKLNEDLIEELSDTPKDRLS